MSKETGGPAFPVPLTDAQEAAWNEAKLPSANGMTLRDYFAAKYMQGCASNPNCTATFHGGGLHETSEWAYKMADAMIKAREQ